MVRSGGVFLTGATGFIGSRLLKTLAHRRYDITCAVRSEKTLSAPAAMVLGTFSADWDWSSALKGCQVVIHAAGRAHIREESSDTPLDEFQKINVDGTLALAKQAADTGVKRFIFLSSIGVNGCINSRPFTEGDTPNPSEPYAYSKWKAEQGLLDIAEATEMEVVIIRPPLVYGPEAPGNFGSLVKWVGRGAPLPLGAVNNKRSFVGLDNLVDLIITCIDHPAAANETFLAGDGQDLSTTELLRGVGKASGKSVRLIPVPANALIIGASLLGKKAVAQRVLGSLQVDISKARDILGWVPPISVEEGLRRCFDTENAS